MSMGGVRPETLYMPPSTTASASGGGVPPNMAYMPQTLPNPTTSQPTTSPQIPTPAAQPVAAGGVAPQPQPAPVDANVAPADNPANDQQPQAVARRFPNIIQEEQESRDWLDILYAFCRLTILLTLVYFYSSPIRCLIVIFVGIAIYMYHIGMFRQQQQRQQDQAQQAAQAQPAAAAVPAANQNGDNNNNINAAENENDNAPATGTEAQPLLDTASTASQNNRNVTALVRTFVVSFLSSLIPEAPAL
jgi:type IV secretory pathway VirB10-like protein